MEQISVSLVCDQQTPRRSLEALLAGTPGVSLLSAHGTADEAAVALESRPCDVMVVRQSIPSRQIAAVRTLAARFPALRVLALAPDPGEDAMLELVRAGAGGCLPAAHTPPSRLLDAIVDLHRGGAPLTPRLATALVRLARQEPSPSATSPRVSPRERELLRLLADGHSYKTAAAHLGLSIDTVRFHLRNLYAKLHVHSKVEAVLKAARSGLL